MEAEIREIVPVIFGQLGIPNTELISGIIIGILISFSSPVLKGINTYVKLIITEIWEITSVARLIVWVLVFPYLLAHIVKLIYFPSYEPPELGVVASLWLSLKIIFCILVGMIFRYKLIGKFERGYERIENMIIVLLVFPLALWLDIGKFFKFTIVYDGWTVVDTLKIYRKTLQI